MTVSDLPPESSCDDVQAREVAGVSLAAAFARAVHSDPLRVAEAAASLHRPVHDEDGLADLLQRAAQVAVDWLPDVDFAGITVQFDRTPFTVADTDPAVLAVDELQYTLDDGPCLHAMRTGTIVAVDAAQAQARWPQLATRAREHGVASYLATPLIVDGVGRGSINLYSRGSHGFPGREADLAAVLSDYVSRGLVDFTVLRTAQTQTTQMLEAMAGRSPIEQAKGILMAVHQITADAAFELLRDQSQRSNTKLRDVAASFVATQAQQPAPALHAPPARTDGAGDFQSAFDHSPIGMAITDPWGVLLTVNPALGRLLGGTTEALVGSTLFDVTHPDDLDAAHAAFDGLRTGAELTAVLAVRLRRADRSWVPVTVSTAKVLATDGSAAHLVMHVEDDTDHHEAAEVLRQQGLRDPLTGLPNRVLFLERLHHAAARHDRASEPVSVLFCDVDDFKAINDAYGHPTGDTVLMALADRLRSSLRPGDTAARLGGDEFALICENTTALIASAVAARLSTTLAAPVDVDGTPVTITVSIGTATSTRGDTSDPAALWKAADTAMYGVKTRRHLH